MWTAGGVGGGGEGGVRGGGVVKGRKGVALTWLDLPQVSIHHLHFIQDFLGLNRIVVYYIE